jgi:hypothetical protein
VKFLLSALCLVLTPLACFLWYRIGERESQGELALWIEAYSKCRDNTFQQSEKIRDARLLLLEIKERLRDGPPFLRLIEKIDEFTKERRLL